MSLRKTPHLYSGSSCVRVCVCVSECGRMGRQRGLGGCIGERKDESIALRRRSVTEQAFI